MIKDSVTVQDVCDLFNEIVRDDPECARALVETRVPCNEAIADHPTIQVNLFEGDDTAKVGLLGFLNGLFGINEKSGMGAVCITVDDQTGRVFGMVKTEVILTEQEDGKEEAKAHEAAGE